MNIENIDQQVAEKLAASLTAETTELLPYIPYLLQDFNELGTDPQIMLDLLRRYTSLKVGDKALDLGCGKGPVAIHLAAEMGLNIKGIDIMPEFIAAAREKAKQRGLTEANCCFVVEDANIAVNTETGYDLLILGAIGDILGNSQQTLERLRPILRPNGYLILDDAYLQENDQPLRFAQECPTFAAWQEIFVTTGWRLLAYYDVPVGQNIDYEPELANIRKRAAELSAKEPEKQQLFAAYVASQEAEYRDLIDGLVGVIWLLQKVDM